MAAREPPATSTEPETASPTVGAEELRRLALRGVLAVALRGFVVRGLSLAASVVLARKLTPDDFGLIAFGLSVVEVGAFFMSGGLGAGLLRQEHEPSREQLEALFGIQLLLATVVAILTLAIGSAFGTAGLLAGIMAWSLPIDAFRVPSAVETQRRLAFGPLVRAE